MQKSKVSAKYSEENSVFGEVSLILVLIQFFFVLVRGERRVGWGLKLISFFYLWDGHLFEVGANSNKYGIPKH